ncbi:MAG: HNH endonuclease [Gammaproteobacteria bacterium]|nr:HNH endonuclease [Gammaproteobacteria bacterium]
MPRSRGGTDHPDNLQLLCSHCNRSKGGRTMAEWRASG